MGIGTICGHYSSYFIVKSVYNNVDQRFTRIKIGLCCDFYLLIMIMVFISVLTQIHDILIVRLKADSIWLLLLAV